ncbi:MAG: hypothetical protein ACR2LZ_12680 [Pyrinomonadaceae bacterium]
MISKAKNKVIPINGKAQKRAERAASRAGRATEEVERLPFDLSALEEEGVFVNVDASGFGMLNRRLDWQALGIRLPEDTDVAFHPPRCGVLPNRYRRPLLTPTTAAHAALHKYSYHFRLTETVFETPAYRWIPWRAFAEFEAAFGAAKDNLETAKREVLKDYDAIRQEVRDTFKNLAEDSAQRLLATGIVVAQDFCERIEAGVLDALPSENELRDGLSLRFQVGVILLGSEMLREQRRAVRERSLIEREQATRGIAEAGERAAADVIQQQLWAERERVRLSLAAEAEEMRREAETKERIRQLKLEAAREKLQETLSPLQEGAAQLRASVYESAVAIHEALAKNEYLPGATAKKACNMAHWFRLMNFQSDTDLEKLITRLEQLAVTGAGKKRTAGNGQVKGVLDNIIELCYRDANALAQPTRLGALEL